MMQKWKKILLGDYPLRRITAVLLLLSVVIMCLVIRNDVPESKEADVVTDCSETVESMNESESEVVGNKLTDVEETEPSAVEGEIEESLTVEESIWKEPESMETLKPIPEETPAPEPTLVPEEIPTPENTPEPEQTPVVHEHSWSFQDWYQEPTCSNGGLVMEICVHCGETQITGGTPTGEHAFQVETPGDCISEAVVVCNQCNYREVREKDLSNHIDVEDGFCYGCGKKTE